MYLRSPPPVSLLPPHNPLFLPRLAVSRSRPPTLPTARSARQHHQQLLRHKHGDDDVLYEEIRWSEGCPTPTPTLRSQERRRRQARCQAGRGRDLQGRYPDSRCRAQADRRQSCLHRRRCSASGEIRAATSCVHSREACRRIRSNERKLASPREREWRDAGGSASSRTERRLSCCS